jgi:hypothetical protein
VYGLGKVVRYNPRQTDGALSEWTDWQKGLRNGLWCYLWPAVLQQDA